MTLRRNTFEALAVGTQPSTGNSGGDNGDAFSVVSFNGTTGSVVDSPTLQGGRALRVTGSNTTAASTGLVGFTGAASRFPAAQMVFRIPAASHPSYPCVSLRNTQDVQVASINLTDARALTVAGIANSGLGTSPPLAVNTNYLLDLRLIQASSPTTSNGGIRARVTRMSDGVEVWSYSTDAANLSTSLINTARFGKTGSVGGVDLLIDSVAYDDDLQAYIAALTDFVAPIDEWVAVSATAASGSWAPVPTARGYQIERDGQVIVTEQAGTSYLDTGLPPGSTPTYRTRAVR